VQFNVFSLLGRLGLIICEDLLWYYPTVDLVASNGVDTIIFPTEWWDEYPHQLPHVDQASWAKALQVKFAHADDLRNIFYSYKEYY
jgi:predicted amidohydrolase